MNNIPGFFLSGIHAGLKKSGKKDLALILSERPSKASAVFTKNIVKAAPVILGQEKMKGGYCQAIIINSGNANACNGTGGYKDALLVSKSISEKLNIDESLVIPSSTGVIGKPLPTGKIIKSLPKLIKSLNGNNVEDAAAAIKTTDKFAKYAFRSFKIGGKTGTICAIGKGAGMICPNMATMLCFILTDLDISRSALNKALKISVDKSFNKITVDGDTSTNDSVFILSNGMLGNKEITQKSRSFNSLVKTLTDICYEVAEMIVRDGEGATKVVKIEVKGAKTTKDAEKIAGVIANSQLTKTAFYGEDANWGRIIGAAGRAGIKFNPDKIELFFDGIKVYSKGKQFQPESKYSHIFKKSKFTVSLNIKEGKADSYILTSDLTHNYVSINADYRT